MATSKQQLHIDSCGRLAAFIDELYGPMTLADLAMLCAEANVALFADTKIPQLALDQLKECEG
jgi:hypothetical protein